MPLTLQEARALQPGESLTFGGEPQYEVLAVTPMGADVHIALRRDDGYETHARAHDLDVAVKVDTPVDSPEEAAMPPDTDKADAEEADDPAERDHPIKRSRAQRNKS